MCRFTSLVLCVLFAWQSGCSMLDEGKRTTKATVNTFKPKKGGYKDASDDILEDDAWDTVGKHARGDQRRTQDSDALSRLIESPKAREINRSLGYD